MICKMNSKSELGIYIHIPFCKQRCAYCDFNSHAGLEGLQAGYVNALVREIKTAAELDDIKGHQVVSVYFGGGTPTVLDVGHLRQISEACRQSFSFCSDVEMTVETNPETVTLERFMALREMGFNRLSIGFQSFQPRLLEILGRKHTTDDAVWSYRLARKAGFDNINIDLIFGIPTETVAEWKDTLKKAADLKPDHLSCYALSVHPGTLLAQLIKKGMLTETEEDEQARMYEFACGYLTGQGFGQYEISNFVHPDNECRHNLIYWKNGDYLGFGAGAHSHFDACRWANVKHPKRYIEKMKEKGEAAVSRVINSDRVEQSETIFMGLRLNTGLDLEEFHQRFGRSLFDIYPGEIAKVVNQRLATSDQRLKLTPRGRLLANDVMREFV